MWLLLAETKDWGPFGGAGAILVLLVTVGQWLFRRVQRVEREAKKRSAEAVAEAKQWRKSSEECEARCIELQEKHQVYDFNLRRLWHLVKRLQPCKIAAYRDGRIAQWDRQAQRIFGYTAEEAVGKPIAMLMPAYNVWKHEQAFEKAASENRHSEMTLGPEVAVDKWGHEFRVEIFLRMIFNSTAPDPRFSWTAFASVKVDPADWSSVFGEEGELPPVLQLPSSEGTALPPLIKPPSDPDSDDPLAPRRIADVT